MLEISFRYMYKTYIMYFFFRYIFKTVMHSEIYDVAFPKQSETQNLMMVNKSLDIYVLLYFRGRLRSLAVLANWCIFIL